MLKNLVKSVSLKSALSEFPGEVSVDPADVRAATLSATKCLVVIDDDPTGSQSVSNIPVITSWAKDDFIWAFEQGLGAVFVLLNTRAEDSLTATQLNTEAVENALAAASQLGISISFVSRGDSTLRGHFPEETDAITAAFKAAGLKANRALLMTPAFPKAGRVTIDGVHYLLKGEILTPVGLTEFANDSTFGYQSSRISDYVEEKTQGVIPSSEVHQINLGVIRTSPEEIRDALLTLPPGSIASIDAVTENDFRMLALGVALAEKAGETFLFRSGPAFVGAWIGQKDYTPLSESDLQESEGKQTQGGLIVIGSHVALTNQQLEQVRISNVGIREIEVNPQMALSSNFDSEIIPGLVAELIEELASSNVILRTSRELIIGATPEESLSISAKVSESIARVVNNLLKTAKPRFVIAKGGITSNDVASKGLEVRHALVVGPLLPGLVSLWRPVDGIAVGMPFVVFPGNVGDEFALAEIIKKLSRNIKETSTL